MKPFKKPAYMLKNTGRAHPLWAQLILFAGLFFLMAFAEAVALLILYTFFPAAEAGPGAADLYCKAGSALAVYVFARALEKQSREQLSLRVPKKSTFFTEYMTGLVSGGAVFALAVLFGVIAGAMSVAPGTEKVTPGTLALYFFGFCLQSFQEELLCRGYILGTLVKRCSLPAAVLLSALFFAALHLFNAGISFIAFLNLLLFGVLTALLTLRRGSVWAASGLHAGWNFLQGNIFGSAVSGLSLGPSVFAVAFAPEKALLNGGSFGPEGGLAVTLTLCLGIGFVLFGMEQKS